MGSIYSFRAKPRSIEGLTFSGFDVLSLANNHIFDYRKEALTDTFSYLKDAGIAYVGAGKDFSEAHTPYIREINGIKFSFLSYTNLISESCTKETSEPAVSFIQEEVMRRDIENAGMLSDVVVVLFHWGRSMNLHTTHFRKTLRIKR